MTNREPAYYAIIPASVRYDKNLCANAKLLYGEITALCNKDGYCWASNNYFAELYGVNKRTVSGWIKELKESGHIKYYVEESYKRKIYAMGDIIFSGDRINHHGGLEENSARVGKKGEHNNTSNTTSNNKSNSQRKNFTPPTKEALMSYCNEIQYNLDYDKFLDYHLARGWELSKGRKIKDWKAVVRTWQKNESKWNKDKPGNKSVNDIHEANVKLFGGDDSFCKNVKDCDHDGIGCDENNNCGELLK